MSLDTLLLLGSIVVPAVGSLLFFAGLPQGEGAFKKLSYLVFGFDSVTNIVLFLKYDFTKDY